MDSEISEWGHPYSDQGGTIDALLLDGLSEDQIITAFTKQYPQHKNPGNRVKRHLNHLRDDHHVNLSLYFGKRTTSAGQTSSNNQTKVLHLPERADIDYAEKLLRKTSDEITDLQKVLDQVEINFKKAGKLLKENWREITTQNIKRWFKKR